MFIILSGFSGLRTFSDSLLEDSDPDLKISTVKGKSFIFSSEEKQILLNNTDIASFSNIIEERVFIQYKDKQQIAYIKGVEKNYNTIIQMDSILNVGTWLDSEFEKTAVIGNGISYKLSFGGVINYTEPLQISVPKPGKGFLNPANAFRTIKTNIIGVYGGSEDFQNKYIFTEIETAQELLQFKKNQVTGIEIKLKDASIAEEIQEAIQTKLGQNLKVETREQLNELYYKVINSENFISYLIFTLIVIIALFNVIGAIIMMIIDKRQNLKTLFNLGSTVKEIKQIFVTQGFLLTLFGMTIGLTIGTIAVLLQKQFGFFEIIPNLAYPVEFKWFNLFVVILTISVLGFIASKLQVSEFLVTLLKNKIVRKLISFLLFIAFAIIISSCASTKKRTVYKVLTKEQADEVNKHFTFTEPKDWNIYIEGHGKLIYSPLGTDIWKEYKSSDINDTITRNKEAKNIFKYNKTNINKKGSYNENFLEISSRNSESLKINSYDDLINWYIRNQNKQFKNNFNYKIIREQNNKFGEIIYFKYRTDNFFNRTYLDALILGEDRFYIFKYTSDNRFYDFYVNDVLKMIKSLKIKE